VKKSLSLVSARVISLITRLARLITRLARQKTKKTKSTYKYAGSNSFTFLWWFKYDLTHGSKNPALFSLRFYFASDIYFFPSDFWVSPRGERAAPRRNPEILGKKINILGEIKSEKKTPVFTPRAKITI
jgi:hypothetical protein